MSAEDWMLVGITATMFLFFGLLGWLRPKLWAWRWADVFYYPLAALGIILLFFTNDINRSLLRIKAEQATAEARWRESPNPQPIFEFAPGSTELLEARFGWFESVRELGEICTISATEGCIVHKAHAEALRAAFSKFSMPKYGDAVALTRAEEDFCRAGFNYVERLARESLFDFGAYNRLKAAFRQLVKGASETQLRTWLANKSVEEQRIFAKITSDQDRAIAAPYIKVESEHSMVLFGQLAWCATRNSGNPEKLKILDAWQAEEATRTQIRARYESDLEIARKNKTLTPLQQVSGWLQQQWWPYILVLALSIKFGKATSGVSSDIDCVFRRCGTRHRKALTWLRRARQKANTSNAEHAEEIIAAESADSFGHLAKAKTQLRVEK